MNNEGRKPPRLEGTDVLPPMESTSDRRGDTGTTKKRRQTGDRFGVLNTFVDFTAAGLRRSDIVVWLVLYRDTKKDGTARTSQADIARRGGICSRTVLRAIRRLCRGGLLTVVYRGGLRRGPSTYRVYPLKKNG